ncbi:hypothetical protein BST96_09455 [Oceanicoccus sagamiensis]|uniref:Toxin SymE-like domain-containing protein n=1 Tax=Oceanicoccus sagamiensis TaxID=716816 RepID=A0A1X9NH78_9GAMM|nr:hypothetical protein BST96_09455 [Oceanicoccus sagamiensis]
MGQAPCPPVGPELGSAQEKFSSFRKLKVRKSYYDYQHNGAYTHRHPTESPPVPWVQIKGYWLNQTGFTIGSPLSVEVQPGCIILKTQT